MRLATLLMVVGIGLSGRALAQEPEAEPTAEQLAEARQLFDDGLRYVQDRLFGRAAIAFRRAAAIKPAPAVLYNLAAAEYELGEVVAAATHARQAIENESAPPELAERARALFETTRSRIAMVTVRTAGDATGALVDGEPLSPEQLGRPLLLEPGTHTVVALRGDERVVERSLDVAAGVEAQVELVVVPSPAEVAAATETEETHLLDRGQLALVVGGSGLLLTILTAIIVFAVAG